MRLGRISDERFCTGLWMMVLLLTAVLYIFIRPASDDYLYVTFGDQGWQGFVETNLDHYFRMSGRVFVHLILYPLLCLDMWPLRIFAAALIGGLSVMASRLASEDGKQGALVRTAAVCVFWMLGIETLQDGALWGAGVMNYLFPVSLVLAYVLMLQRLLDGRGSSWMGIPAFFCASTVEMTGILPCVAFVYLCATNWEKVRKQWGRILLLGLCTLAGYLFLYTSPGVATRLENNSSNQPLWDTILMNYAILDRMMIGPEGVWAVTALTLTSCAPALLKEMPGWGWVVLISAGLVVLTGLGIIYDGVAVALIAIAAFAVLAGFSVWSFLRGERQIPLWMLCVTVSLGICLVSPVMGARLAMPSAVFMMVMFGRNLAKLQLPRRQMRTMIVLLTAAACTVLVDYSVHCARNAQVIDENTRITQAHREGTLVLELAPDERYCGPAVPTVNGFEFYFLKHHGLEGTQCAAQDPTEAAVSWGDEMLDHKALLRDGSWYIPIRAAEDIGAEVRWEQASAVVQLEDQLYCFHEDNWVANLGHGITHSVKLSGPVRSIAKRIYIPISDFNKIFSVTLTVLPNE